MINRYIATICLCLSLITVNAQNKTRENGEIEVSGFYGMSGLTGTIPNGKLKPELNYQVFFTKKYFLTSNLGIGSGVGYAAYSSAGELSSYSSSTPIVDDEAENFEYRVTGSGIKEELKLSAIEIPIFLAFGKPQYQKFRIQANIGLKLSLPISASYQCTEGTLATKGYYTSNNVEYANMPNHGFETIDKVSYSGKLSAAVSLSLFGNVGVIIPIGKIGFNLGVYGSYGSYGLTSVLNPASSSLVDYPGSYNSLSSLSTKVSLISAGVRIGFVF